MQGQAVFEKHVQQQKQVGKIKPTAPLQKSMKPIIKEGDDVVEAEDNFDDDDDEVK